MKKLLTAILALAFLLCACHARCATPASQADSGRSMIDNVIKQGVMRVGVASFVPWTMQSKSGDYIGFEIDVAKRLAKDLGVELELVPTKFSGIIPALLADKFDIIIGSVGVTPERNLKGNFSIPYDYSTIEVFANKEKTKGMKYPEDYNKPETIIAVRSGSMPAILAKKLFPNATVRLFDDEAPAVRDVINGSSHMMISSAPLPAFEVLKNPRTLYQPTTEPLIKQPVGFVIRKGDVDSLNVLDNWIRMVEEEGWLKDRRDYWFRGTDWQDQVQ